MLSTFLVVGASSADTLVLNSHGDSITFGVETLPSPPGSSNGGYRYHLDELLTGSGMLPSGFTDYRFIGGLNDPAFEGSLANSADTHYGIRGIEASAIGRGLFESPGSTAGDNITFGNQPGENSLAFRVENRGSSTGYYPFNPDGGTPTGSGNVFFTPDRMLVHIGTNTLSQISNTYADATASLAVQSQGIAAEASWQLGDYLQTLDDAFDANPAANAPDSKFIVARVIPLLSDQWGSAGGGGASDPVADGNLVGELQASFLYNYGDGSTPGLGMDEVIASVSDRVEFVDMFRIDINDLDTVYLAGVAGVNEATLLTLIDNDSDDYVDWALDIDESDYDSLVDVSGYNLNLIGDGIHPTDLGYAVMANVYYNQLVPEPSTGLTLLAGVGLLYLRRRRMA